MKNVQYMVPKGVVDLYAERGFDVKGKTVSTREAESDAEILQLVENGDPENRRKLAQSALDIIVQRAIRNYLESEEAAKLAQTPGGLDAVFAEAQKISDEYVYGARQQSTGQSAVTRAERTATQTVLSSVDLSDEGKVKQLRKYLGDAAVDALIAAKKAADDAEAAKAAKAAATPAQS